LHRHRRRHDAVDRISLRGQHGVDFLGGPGSDVIRLAARRAITVDDNAHDGAVRQGPSGALARTMISLSMTRS
jgi:hypothetical protein